MSETVLVRYGVVGEVARFAVRTERSLRRGERVVVRSGRGLEVGTLLQPAAVQNGDLGTAAATTDNEPAVLRSATAEDEHSFDELRAECEGSFDDWCRRILDWNLDMQLIDLEWTLDRTKLILYVLNDRGPDCTKLALQAAAAGLGIIEVQPVDGNGLVTIESSAGGGCCSSGGCGA